MLFMVMRIGGGVVIKMWCITDHHLDTVMD